MKSGILIILLLFAYHGIAQDFTALNDVLSKKYSKESIADGRWVYYPEKSEIVKLHKPLVQARIPGFEFFEVTLTNFLGYHINEGRCLVLFDSTTSEIKLVEPLWFGDISKEFIKLFLNKEFQTDVSLFAFLDELNSLMEVGSGYRFINTFSSDSLIRYNLGYFKDDSYTTTGSGITSTITYNENGIWRKVKIHIRSYAIIRYSFFNPATKEIETIE